MKKEFKPFGRRRMERDKLLAQALEFLKKDTSTDKWVKEVVEETSVSNEFNEWKINMAKFHRCDRCKKEAGVSKISLPEHRPSCGPTYITFDNELCNECLCDLHIWLERIK